MGYTPRLYLGPHNNTFTGEPPSKPLLAQNDKEMFPHFICANCLSFRSSDIEELKTHQQTCKEPPKIP